MLQKSRKHVWNLLGFLGLNFMKWATFVLGKMIKRYKKQSRPCFTRRIKFKIFWLFNKKCLFAKVAVVNLWQASELNLCKKPMSECLSYRSFCQNLIAKNSRFSFGKYRCFRLCLVMQSVYLKKRKRITPKIKFVSHFL